MVLAHVYPKEISTSELTVLLGYSKESRYLYKNEALKALELENLIKLTKPARNLTQIKINEEHTLLKKFYQICKTEGTKLSEELLGKLLDEA